MGSLSHLHLPPILPLQDGAVNVYIPPDFHFAKIHNAFLFLLAIPIAYLFLQNLANKKKFDALFHQNLFNPTKEFWNGLFLSLSFLCFVISLMEPEGYIQKQEDSQKAVANLNQPLPILFLLDTSLSMETRDAPFTKSRLEQAKEIISSFLPKLSSYPKALFTFQDHLQPIIPLTYDSTYIELTLDAISASISSDGTNFLQMLRELQSLLETKKVVKPRQIILLSDGEDTATHPNTKEMDQIAAGLAKNGITLTAIGLGTKTGLPIPDLTYKQKPILSHLNEPLLRGIAEAAEGRYVNPNDVSVNSLTENLMTQFNMNTYEALFSNQPKVSYAPLFPLFLLIGLLAFIRSFH